MSQKRAGFSRIDVLVAVLMSITVMGLLLPAVLQANQSADRKIVLRNLKELGLAVHNYHDVYNKLPPASDHSGQYGQLAKAQDATLSMHLLPYTEQAAVAIKIIADNKAPTDLVIRNFAAPQDPSTKDFVRVQNFAGNVRVFTDDGFKTAWNKDVTLKKEMPCTMTLGIIAGADGTSNIVMLSTRYAAAGELSKGGASKTPCGYYDLPTGNDGGAFFGATPMAKSPLTATSASGWQVRPSLKEVNCKAALGLAHAFEKDGIAVCLVDGSVRIVAPAIAANTWNYALCPTDGNVLGADW